MSRQIQYLSRRKGLAASRQMQHLPGLHLAGLHLPPQHRDIRRQRGAERSKGGVGGMTDVKNTPGRTLP